MELDVAAARKQIGESFTFTAEETVEPQQYAGRTIRFAAPLQVQGAYVFDGKDFTLTAEARTVLDETCARCGKAFQRPYEFSVSERFTKSLAQDDPEESYSYMGDRMDISKAVMDNFYLHLPLVSLCREDCKGLCPVCGANLNETQCTCQPTEAKNPFSVLASLSDKE